MKTKIALRHFQSASQDALHAHLFGPTTTHLSGRRLTVARFGTMSLVALTIAAFLPSMHDLLVIVEKTMQPAHVSLWLRPRQWDAKQTTRLLPCFDEEERKSR